MTTEMYLRLAIGIGAAAAAVVFALLLAVVLARVLRPVGETWREVSRMDASVSMDFDEDGS